MARGVHIRSLLSALASRTLVSVSSGVRLGLKPRRAPHSLQCRPFSAHRILHSTSQGNSTPGDKIFIHFVNQNGVKSTTSVTEGVSLLDVVIKKNIDLSGFGACEGTLACSTCHLVFEEDVYKKMEPLVDEEVDMLDLAYGLTKTSRLGCQVCVQKWMDGMTVEVPKDIKDMRDPGSAENQ